MSKPHGNYNTEFRQQAVDLLLSSGRPLKVVATDLGISANSLRLWRNRALSNGRGDMTESCGWDAGWESKRKARLMLVKLLVE